LIDYSVTSAFLRRINRLPIVRHANRAIEDRAIDVGGSMRLFSKQGSNSRVAGCFLVAAMFSVMPASWASEPTTRLSGPFTHNNLAVYLIHGASADGPVPLTLAEALGKGSVRVIETGSVNELQIENTGNDDIFVQSGDIVKGGKQDRVLTVSLLLPPKSGKVSIASFCVEQGRWTARGQESVAQFASSVDSLPSREAKLAMKAPIQKAATQPEAPVNGGVSGTVGSAGSGRTTQQRGRDAAADETSLRQRGVWDEVAKTQQKLSSGLGARVAAPQSATSLQLSLENEALKSKRTAYIAALADPGRQSSDVVGYVFAINGRLNSADVYPSNGLFKKMWDKLLAASVTEAIGDVGGQSTSAAAAAPSIADVQTFLKAAEAGQSDQKTIAKLMVQDTRNATNSLYVEAKRADGRWVHRNYLAK
jgi:hypothetical protein